MSPAWPTPPPLSTRDSAARVCSGVGDAEVRDSGMSAPSPSRPCGAWSTGGANSMCREPKMVVSPIFAVALAGNATSPLSFMLTSA